MAFQDGSLDLPFFPQMYETFITTVLYRVLELIDLTGGGPEQPGSLPKSSHVSEKSKKNPICHFFS